jgi:hypothetical protein
MNYPITAIGVQKTCKFLHQIVHLSAPKQKQREKAKSHSFNSLSHAVGCIHSLELEIDSTTTCLSPESV